MSYNSWLYGYANPIVYIDPTGQTSTTALARFTRENENALEWTQFDMQTVDEAVWEIAIAYANAYNRELHERISGTCGQFIPLLLRTPTSAFMHLHGGPITFVRKADDSGYWGYTRTKSEIWIYSKAKFDNKRFVVHEMGHAFENALFGQTG